MFDQVLDNFKVKLNEQKNFLLNAYFEAVKVVEKLGLKNIYIWGVDYDLQGSICIGINSIDRLSKSDLNKIDVIELKYLDSYFTDEIFSTGDWIYQDLSNKNIEIYNLTKELVDILYESNREIWSFWHYVDDNLMSEEIFYSYGEKMKYIFQEFCFSVREEAIQKNELCREYMDNRLFFVIEHDDSLEEAIERNYIKTGRIVV
jgi:hypothetical protein